MQNSTRWKREKLKPVKWKRKLGIFWLAVQHFIAAYQEVIKLERNDEIGARGQVKYLFMNPISLKGLAAPAWTHHILAQTKFNSAKRDSAGESSCHSGRIDSAYKFSGPQSILPL